MGCRKVIHCEKSFERIAVGIGGPITKPYVLVSLYGLKSPEEIDDAMVTALHPWRDSDGFRIASSLAKAVLKHRTGFDIPKVKSSDLINRLSADLFVFDDLERCDIPIAQALGYINNLVERDGCKVIIIGNQEEIKDNADYLKGKEKLIGKILEISPDFESAFGVFLEGVSDKETRSFFEAEIIEIQEVYHQSNLKNLRVLQQTMWDFERVYAVIDSLHRENIAAMRHLLKLFFALSFECKAGGLTESDLNARSQYSYLVKMIKETEPTALSLVNDKYSGLDVRSSILTDKVLGDILIRGFVNGIDISRALDDSSWFVSQHETSWRTLWHSVDRPDADVRVAAIAMSDEFAARHYKLTGEILHLFGQMLFLADIGFSGRNREQTVEDCKAYVDDLRAEGALESPREAYLDDIRHGSYGGLGFAQNETPEFGAIWKYVSEQRALAEIESFSRHARQLLDLMKTDPSAFVRQISYHRGAAAPFASKPVLATADPGEFAETLIGLDPMDLREILLGLSARYDMAKLADGRELSGERNWAEALEAALKEKASVLEPFARDRISKNVDWTFGKVLTELREPELPQPI